MPEPNKRARRFGGPLNRFRVSDAINQRAGGLRVGVGSRGTHVNQLHRGRHPESELVLKSPHYLEPECYTNEALLSSIFWCFF